MFIQWEPIDTAGRDATVSTTVLLMTIDTQHAMSEYPAMHPEPSNLFSMNPRARAYKVCIPGRRAVDAGSFPNGLLRSQDAYV